MNHDIHHGYKNYWQTGRVARLVYYRYYLTLPIHRNIKNDLEPFHGAHGLSSAGESLELMPIIPSFTRIFMDLITLFTDTGRKHNVMSKSESVVITPFHIIMDRLNTA